MTQLAIDILKSEPTAEEDNRRIRAWAVDVMQRHSGVPIPNATKEDLEVTPVLPRVAVPRVAVVGRDDRSQVLDTATFPWSAICHLTVYASDGTREGGTGIVIGPSAVVTADYVIFPRIGSAQIARTVRVEITPGRSGNGRPHGTFMSTEFHRVGVAQQGVESADGLAVIVLQKPIGKGVTPLALADRPITPGAELMAAGYPMDLLRGSLYRSIGKVLRVDAEAVYHDVDTASGMSGAPIWLASDSSFTVLGIHLGSDVAKSKHALRLTAPILRQLAAFQD